jgi:hypothetical protein
VAGGGRLDHLVDEGELLHRAPGEDEGIRVGQAHAPVETVQGDGERNPAGHEVVEGVQVEAADREGRRARNLGGRARPERQAEGARGLQSVGHVEVVGPGLGPVFPGVHGGVGADERLLPAGGRAAVVVALLSLGVVRPLVAEQRAKSILPAVCPGSVAQ